MDNCAIEMIDVSKSFATVQAVKSCSFDLKQGEIHSLIGENGAGKSTMMKLLYGIYPIDSGVIKINGEQVQNILVPKVAIAHGIGMVHQEFMLVNELTVLENIILGFEPKKGLSIDFAAARARIDEYINKYEMNVEPDKKITQISVGQAQRVEIIKTLIRGAKTIILDEPTGVLTPQEVEKLFEILRGLRNSGISIIFISHKLNEVMRISDRISVMRDGRHVGMLRRDEADITKLTNMMVGRNVMLDIKRVPVEQGATILEVEDLWTSGEKEMSKLRGVSLNVHAGEIVGIAGIDGNGQTELAEAVAGIRKAERGRISLSGSDVTKASVRKRRKLGLAHIPEDRNITGLNRNADIETNLIAVNMDSKPFSRAGLVLNRKAIRQHALELIHKFEVRPEAPTAAMMTLSGGNAQKVVVAREINQKKDVLLAVQPTRGIDVGAIEGVRKHLIGEKKRGVGILLISTELEEIMTLSDRILVMYEGKIAGEFPDAANVTEMELGNLMLGGSKSMEALANE